MSDGSKPDKISKIFLVGGSHVFQRFKMQYNLFNREPLRHQPRRVCGSGAAIQAGVDRDVQDLLLDVNLVPRS